MPWPPSYKPPQLPMYDGHSDPKQFLMSYEDKISLYGGNTAVMTKSFGMAVRSVTQTWYSSLWPCTVTLWQKLKYMLRWLWSTEVGSTQSISKTFTIQAIMNTKLASLKGSRINLRRRGLNNNLLKTTFTHQLQEEEEEVEASKEDTTLNQGSCSIS
jgi:hypothetical protein